MGLKVDMPSNMDFLLEHMSSARMRGKSLLLNWNVGTDVKLGLSMDKMIDRVLAFKKDPDGNSGLETTEGAPEIGSRIGEALNRDTLSSRGKHRLPQVIRTSNRLQDCQSKFKDMHYAAVESYLLICNAIEQEKFFSTRNFDTCQTKGRCSRVRLFQKK
jgi:hypothetical protein